MLKKSIFLAVIALAALTRAGSLEEIVDANGELTLNLTPYDWARYMDFADRVFSKGSDR